MALSDLIKRGIETVEKVAGSLRAQVHHRAFLGVGSFEPSWAPSEVARQALVEWVADDVGQETRSKAKLTFFESLPVNERDQFRVPDMKGGTVTLEVQTVKALLDPDGQSYLTEVWLGDRKQ